MNSIDTLTISAESARIEPSPQVSLQLLVCSNSTFFGSVEQTVCKTLAEMDFTGQCVGFVLLLLLFLLGGSEHVFEKIFLPSLSLLRNLSDFVKNKDEKEFNRLLDSYTPKILEFLVGYFKKFLWVHKLQKATTLTVYKHLLLEGIAHFDPDNYPSVLLFIYSELIVLEQIRIDTLLKMLELSRRNIGFRD